MVQDIQRTDQVLVFADSNGEFLETLPLHHGVMLQEMHAHRAANSAEKTARQLQQVRTQLE